MTTMINGTNEPEQKKIKLAVIDPELVSKQIGGFIVDSVLAGRKTGCVIGLSGGIDSTTTAALIKKAFDEYNSLNRPPLELVGYIIPSKLNTAKDTEDGVEVAKRLNIRNELIYIDKIIEAHEATNPEAFQSTERSRCDKGNMISRIRANILSTKAATENKMLAGTGNKDEDFGIGYYTLFGDGAVHISPIGNLPKRLVRQMAKYLGFSDYFVFREPAAGLEPGQTDFKDLGYGYDVVELVTEGIRQGFTPSELVGHYQIKPLVERQIASQMSPKLKTVDAVVYDVLNRNKGAVYKANILHPPIAPITLTYE